MKVKKSDGTWATLYTKPIGDTYPIGMYGWFAGDKAPTNWLRCDGQLVLKSEYPELFKAIGTTHNKETDTDETKFRLPNVNLEHRTLIGSSGDGEFGVGNTMGEEKHTMTVAELAKHSHGISCGWTSGDSVKVFYNSNNGTNSLGTETMGESKPFNIMQPSMAAVCCIKAKQSVGLVGNVVSNINAQGDNDVAPTKIIKDYVDDHAKSANIIKTGITDPNTETVGNFVGQIYCNTRKDTAYQLVSITKIDGETYYNWTKLVRGNDKVTSLSSNSTDEQYPSAKAVKNYVDKKNTYSTDETVVGTWLGKPLYRKVIDFGTLPNSSAKSVQHGIQNLKNLIFIGGVVTDTAGTSFVLPSYRANDIYGIEMWITTTEVTIVTGNNRTNATAYITLEYTKTTDV